MKSALLFPPLMTLKKGSFRELYDHIPHVQRKFEEASNIIGIDLAEQFFSDNEKIVNTGIIARPSIVTIATALYELLREKLGKVDYFLGPSLGQVTAFHCSGCLDFKDTLNMVRVMCDLEAAEFQNKSYSVYFFYNIDTEIMELSIDKLSKKGYILEPCMHATSNQMIVNGDFESLEKLNEEVQGYGALAVKIPYGPPGHCSLLESVKKEFDKSFMTNVHVKKPLTPLISNVDAKEIIHVSKVAHDLVEQYTNSVQWYQSLKELSKKGVQKLFVLGPGNFVYKSLEFTDIEFEIVPLVTLADVQEMLGILQMKEE
ncbi:malonyl CoA-acyl carrier protein transacylase [Bacillus manliponensis]|uniref:[acyl-carrier-protein] S-malonyltransferase n=1 Tax=Bacillus manliponensis TaxID=574376 RepID=A0A073KG61_9BACI|nr:ACP S-malonyltransferase [Bacillus manliponensis]KEK21303.1 malonyl CoA-acyl carrier protein transacylase [Bacillus manliponensis]